MPPGLDSLKHIVVLMMENRSFDHMLGSLRQVDPRIDGLIGTESNPDTAGGQATVAPLAQYQSQLDPDPNHDFAPVNQQIFNGGTTANMQGFVASYFEQRRDVSHSRKIMYYFKREKLPVLTTLALEYAVFNRWFSSIPGPTLCNRAFAHYGTSFGHVGMELFYANQKFKSIYQRLEDAGRTAKIYYFDQKSSTMEIVNLLQNQPQFFGTYDQFLNDCQSGTLPQYSFIEPNFSDHDSDGGALLASDQHPDHHVLEGERFIATIYNAIKGNPALWESTALLITYDEHGGIYDHVPPPACTPDGFVAQPAATGTNKPFLFDRLGVRVPAVLVSPWVPRNTVIDGRVFEHASIPATVTQWLIGAFDNTQRTPREAAAETFLDLLSLGAKRSDGPNFNLGVTARAAQARVSAAAAVPQGRMAAVAPQAPVPEIVVPKPPTKAFNPARPASGLIQGQIQHLEAAAGIFPKKPGARPKKRSEGASADYIEKLTAQVYARAGQVDPEIAVPQQPPPIAGTPTPTSTTRTRTAVPVATATPPAGSRRSSSAATRRSAATTPRRIAPKAKRRAAPKAKRRKTSRAKTTASRRRGR